MKKVWVYVVIGLLVALLLAAGIFWMVDRSRFEDFMQEGIHEYHGYTRLDFEETVYCLPNDATDFSEAASAATFAVSGIIQPEIENIYGGKNSMAGFLGSMSISEYPLALEAGRDSFSASNDGKNIHIARLHKLNEDYDGFTNYEGYTYWLMMSAKDPSVYAIYIYEDGAHIATAYPGETPEEAQESYQAFREWFPGDK